MKISRRSLAGILPAAAMKTMGQEAALPSRVWKFEEMPVHANGQNRGWPILNGRTHTGFPIEAHQTELAPGQMPHPAHHHVKEEMVLVREGTLEVTISGKTTRLGPGSAAFVASGEEHGWRNVGATCAVYFVLAFGADQ